MSEKKRIRLPSTFSRLSVREIEALAMTGSEETDVLMSLGLSGKHLEKAREQKLWRKTWDRARAKWIIEKNKQISESDDVRILSLLAQKTMPESEIEGKYVFVVDAPEWFLKVLDKKNEAIKVNN